MPQLDHQKQQLSFLIWFLRKQIHDILSSLNQGNGLQTDDLADVLKGILETVTLAEYLDEPIDKKIGQLTQFKYFVQTLSGTDIHGSESYRRGPNVD